MNTIHNTSEKLILLLWSLFPTIEIFQRIRSNKHNISFIKKIVSVAWQRKLIQEESESEFMELIRRYGETHKSRKPAAELNFEMLIYEIKKDISIKKLVLELKNIAGNFGLEKTNEVTFTRLKQDFHPKTVKKQHTLLALTIWLAVNKPELNLNFSTITNFPRRQSGTQHESKEGILMELSFFEPHGKIDPKVIKFLKDTLPSCAQDLEMYYLNEACITYLATTCFVKFPIQEGFNRFPQNYDEAMSNALSLSYQLMVSWQLTHFNSSKIQLIVGIDAGEFRVIADSIQDLFHSSLAGNQSIRLSHLAYMIVKRANISVIVKETSFPNVWAIDHFWCFPYFKSIPDLLPHRLADGQESSLLPVRDRDVEAFQSALFLNKDGAFPLLDIMLGYPPKARLALEVAHIATLRRMNHEAVQIISNVLSVEPYNLVALTMRMVNFIILGNNAQEWDTACLFFDRALSDGLFIEKYCPPDPEFYVSYGLVFYAKALKLIHFLRRQNVTGQIEVMQKEVMQYLEKAEFYYRMEMSVSSNSTYCGFWFAHCFLFRKLLEKYPQLITDKSLPFADHAGIYVKELQFIYKLLGIPNPNMDKKTVKHSNFQPIFTKINRRLSSISDPSCYAGHLFTMAMLLWDHSTPEYKAQIIDLVLTFLDMALDKIATLKKISLGIYTYTGIRSPHEFTKIINKVKYFLKEIKRRNDYTNPAVTSFMNLDEDIGYEPITYDLIQREEES